MHHPEIYDIISIIEDYYILTDTKFRCQIEPFVCERVFSENSDPIQAKGFKIVRQLNNGRIEVAVFGCFGDNDSVSYQYFAENSERPDMVLEVVNQHTGGYSTIDSRAAIREIVLLDRELGRKSEANSEPVCR
ncbi:hypothetical protein [Chamaesiphon sp. OTE_75_metabat_556]|uniref:hypothetical protein n=1 Tax=Chamaesiphon sp. OTE_75_metabat_556 TaxID=2964692 RepID=UPI00286BFE7B|nr:hypothetical protein [Chamaesiphon sp. OTE_75_metabat_556]